QNQVGTVGSATLGYDADGDLTTDESGQQYAYDAWGRLVAVRDGLNNLVKSYQYDALGRRTVEFDGTDERELYYSSAWQVLEERVGGQADTQYVWSPVYADALVMRDRDTDGDGTIDQSLWVLQDANYDVTALVAGNGPVVERFAYDPYGSVTVLDAT